MSKWKGVRFNRDYKPHRFNHRGKSYVWEKLTAEEIAELAADPTFTLFTEQPPKKAATGGRRGSSAAAADIDDRAATLGE